MFPGAVDQVEQPVALDLFQDRRRSLSGAPPLLEHRVEVLGVAIPKPLLTRHADKHVLRKDRHVVEDVSLGKFRYWSHRFLRTRLGARSLGRFQDTDSDNERRYRKELYRRVRPLA